ncbi:MAG: cytochrome c-type biogenesis protein CcmH [Oceanospirillales bacterium LUC14_002_19_P2]|nr:MAG: cytochrome c-type biogenesis protein CcmH [Oceanospirillales bacterium LUC14_002_19_P2]
MRRAAIAFCLLLPLSASASIDTWEFDDPAQFDRYKVLTEELRCPKCQNQNIADSNAPIANDLRAEVYRMLQTGQSNEQIVDFMLDRYGEFVLYKPRLSAGTLLLWFGPLLFLVAGGVTLFVIIRRNRQTTLQADNLTAAEKDRLKQLLEGRESS